MNVLVVDDHHLIRDAVRGVLSDIIGESVRVFEATSAGQALRRVQDSPDIEFVLLDLALPDCDGLELLARIRALHPSIAVVVLSALEDRPRIARAFELGAVGYIPKSTSREVLESAIKLVLAGGVYIPAEVLAGSRCLEIGERQAAAGERLRAHDGLTSRQREVLWLIMQGKSNKEICRELDLAPPTVKIHVSAILKALNVRNRTEAALAGRRLGIALEERST